MKGRMFREVTKQLNVLANTIHKAIPCRTSAAGSKKSERTSVEVSNKSERSQIDSQAPMGYATTRTLDRVAAAIGVLESAAIEFEATSDVAAGGVLIVVTENLVGLVNVELPASRC